jgi:drug/metabolite transporter (DMT)-like permease
MILFLALLAATGCAIFNGIAAILEKIGAGVEKKAISLHPGLLWKLRTNRAYLIGIILDLIAWMLTLFAVHNLPLFLVQPIIACSVMITIVIEHFLLKHRFKLKFIAYVILILLGLIMLALVSTQQKSSTIASTTKWFIVFGPLILADIGSLFIKIQKHYGSFILAAFSGLAFGGVSVAGRAIVFSHPYTHILSNPLFWAIIAYGLVAILFFTIALQRETATTVNATMIAFETIVPIIIGLTLLGDHPKNNLWIVVVIGVVLTFSGTILIAISSKDG